MWVLAFRKRLNSRVQKKGEIMGLYKYSIDGSRLSLNDRKKLMQLLDDYSDSGLIYVDIKKVYIKLFLKKMLMFLLFLFLLEQF